MKRWIAVGAALLALCALPPDAFAQAPPKINAEQMALAHLAGRYRMPLTCVRADGSRVQVHESVSFRIQPTAGSGRSGVKATFYGIPIKDAVSCSNPVTGPVLDRRGALYLHFRHYDRADLGVSDFRRAARDGELSYYVHRGQLSVREVGAPESTARRIELGGGDDRVVVRAIRPGTDAWKLFEDAESQSDRQRKGKRSPPERARRLTFTIHGPDDFRSELHTRQAPARRRSAP